MWAYHELIAPEFLGEDTVVTCRTCGLTFRTKANIERAANETCHPIMTDDYQKVKLVDGKTVEVLVGQKIYRRA